MTKEHILHEIAKADDAVRGRDASVFIDVGDYTRLLRILRWILEYIPERKR